MHKMSMRTYDGSHANTGARLASSGPTNYRLGSPLCLKYEVGGEDAVRKQRENLSSLDPRRSRATHHLVDRLVKIRTMMLFGEVSN